MKATRTCFSKAIFAALILCVSALHLLAQQPTPPQDFSAPLQLSFMVPVDSNSINQLINIINFQTRSGRKDFIILVSSQGGEVLAGLAAYNYLHGLGVNITTFNIGQVDSAANLIFCAGKHRYALPDSRFLIHSSFTGMPPGTPLNAAFLDGQLQQVRSMNSLMAQVIETTTGKNAKEIEAAIDSQKILTPPEAKAWGLIQEERKDFTTPGAQIATVQPDSPSTVGASAVGAFIPQSSISSQPLK